MHIKVRLIETKRIFPALLLILICLFEYFDANINNFTKNKNNKYWLHILLAQKTSNKPIFHLFTLIPTPTTVTEYFVLKVK